MIFDLMNSPFSFRCCSSSRSVKCFEFATSKCSFAAVRLFFCLQYSCSVIHEFSPFGVDVIRSPLRLSMRKTLRMWCKNSLSFLNVLVSMIPL